MLAGQTLSNGTKLPGRKLPPYRVRSSHSASSTFLRARAAASGSRTILSSWSGEGYGSVALAHVEAARNGFTSPIDSTRYSSLNDKILRPCRSFSAHASNHFTLLAIRFDPRGEQKHEELQRQKHAEHAGQNFGPGAHDKTSLLCQGNRQDGE